MQREVSKSAKKAVVKNHLQGLDRNENLKSLSSSGNKLTAQEVDTVIDEFGKEADRRGLEVVAKDYGVSNLAIELGGVARFCRDNKVELQAMLEGGKVAAALKKFGAGIPEFEQFLTSVYSRSLEKGYTPKEIIAQSAKLESLEKKHGMKFEQLVSKFDETGKELAVKKKEKSSIDQEIERVEKKKSDLLAKFSLDEQKILDYAKTKQELEMLGLDVASLQSIKTFLVILKNEKFDPKAIINKINSLSDLQAQKAKIQQDLARAIQELDAKKVMLAELRRMEESKLGMEQIERLRGIVNRISVDNKIDPQLAYNQFEQDVLQNYNSVLGLRPEAARLEEKRSRAETELEAKKKELDALEQSHAERVRKLEEKYAKQKSEIDAYGELRSLGVDGKRILAWQQIMKNANLDFGVVESELRNQANLRAIEDKVSAKVKDLLAEEMKLNQTISSLSQEKQKLESSIKTLREATLSEIEAASSKALSAISSLNEQARVKLEQTAQQSQKTLDEMRNSSQKEIRQTSEQVTSELKATTTELKSSAGSFTKELKELLDKASPEIKEVHLALETGEKIGKFRNIVPLLHLMDGNANGDETEALIAMWNLTSRFNTWLEANHPESKKDISEPLAKLLVSINDEIQKVGGAAAQ